MLEVEGVRAGYGAINILWDVSISVQAGQLTTIIGPNGAGKTTLLKMLSGLIHPTAGEALSDFRIDHEQFQETGHIGTVPIAVHVGLGDADGAAAEGAAGGELLVYPAFDTHLRDLLNPAAGCADRGLGHEPTLVGPTDPEQRAQLAPPGAHHSTVATAGGVPARRRLQYEYVALGVPLLVLREKTERPEALWTGNMRLVGTDSGRIVAAVRELLGDPVALAAMAEPSLPYGDGRAGDRIAALIEHWLAGRFADAPHPIQRPGAEGLRSS